MTKIDLLNNALAVGDAEQLFEKISSDILDKGYSINFNALPPQLSESLWLHLQNMDKEQFVTAGVGREQNHKLNRFIRNDKICWINGESAAGKTWLDWTNKLQVFLNRQLFLGLFSFESHFSFYAPGSFYKKHLDAFKGESNRKLSLVFYLNPGWLPEDGGELVIYPDDQNSIRVTPSYGTLVAFLSEEMPHEVLVSNRDRYAIAGWFRVNSSTLETIDPPR
jgi:SM-20-related protein